MEDVIAPYFLENKTRNTTIATSERYVDLPFCSTEQLHSVLDYNSSFQQDMCMYFFSNQIYTTCSTTIAEIKTRILEVKATIDFFCEITFILLFVFNSYYRFSISWYHPVHRSTLYTQIKEGVIHLKWKDSSRMHSNHI